jgi:hypothetical protein
MLGMLKRSLRSVALIMVMCMVWVSSVAAATPTPTPDAKVSAQEVALAQKAASFARITSNGIVFDQESALKAGLSKDYVTQMATFYDSLTKLENGKQFNWDKLLAEQKNRQHVTYGEVKPDSKGEIGPDASFGRGRGWAGSYVQVTFTEYETVLIVDALTGVATLAGAYTALAAVLALPTFGITLPGVVIAGFAAAAFGIGAWGLNTIDHIGGSRGIYFRLYSSGISTIWHN